ncbi:MAG: fibronectin type III-like domain-contianing protein, partial [Oscillospiraceae bacterium]|nr:fibronectin type III-like domain-contianing protein [Oscillospiraceae bacterium]
TQTWYKDDSQLTDNKDGFLLNYDIIPAKTDGLGRTYMYMTGTPQYPFGYGLSYTNFTVTNVTVDKTAAAANDKLQVTATVTNTGDVKGAEVVQVYFKAPNAGNGAVPKKQLCGFARVELAPKASQTVTIQVDVSDFSAIDETTVGDFDPDRSKIDPQNVDLNTVSGGGHGKRIVKTGNYTLEVGNSSVNVAGSATVNVTAGLADKVKLVTLEYSKLTMMIGQTMPAPTLSVCLSDETFPTTGYTVTYASSSPAVTVDPATGAATAASGGTALITATVTYKGQTYTGTAPVAVANYPYVTDIKIDGAVLNGFSINRDRYEYTVPYSQGAMPAITFTNPDPAGITAELKMPSKINGRATLTVSKPGEQTMTYIIDMAYPADPNNNPLIGTIRKDSGMVSRINGTSELYTDWGQGEIILSEDGGTGINLLNAKYNPENIWLTFTLSISGNQEKYPNFAQHVGSGSSINFRSGERTGFGEGRFGWYMSREWNLHYGDNYVRVPLYHALTKPADYFINNDKDINVDTYQIEVNGAQVSFSSSVLTRERIRGYIYFSDVKQVLCNIQTTGISSADIGSFATKIDDFRFVDESGKELVASKRAALQEALTAAADETRGSYTKGSWAAYTETLVTAARVAEFADEVEPFNYYLDLISNRDKGVLRQLGFVEESADKDKVSVTDARMVLQHLVQKITLTPAQLDAAAVDGAENDDGSPKVSITDARLILQYLVEKINKFPATE